MEEYIFNISGEEIQERLDAVPNKADKNSVYTKTEVDRLVNNVELCHAGTDEDEKKNKEQVFAIPAK